MVAHIIARGGRKEISAKSNRCKPRNGRVYQRRREINRPVVSRLNSAPGRSSKEDADWKRRDDLSVAVALAISPGIGTRGSCRPGVSLRKDFGAARERRREKEGNGRILGQ